MLRHIHVVRPTKIWDFARLNVIAPREKTQPIMAIWKSNLLAVRADKSAYTQSGLKLNILEKTHTMWQFKKVTHQRWRQLVRPTHNRVYRFLNGLKTYPLYKTFSDKAELMTVTSTMGKSILLKQIFPHYQWNLVYKFILNT